MKLLQISPKLRLIAILCVPVMAFEIGLRGPGLLRFWPILFPAMILGLVIRHLSKADSLTKRLYSAHLPQGERLWAAWEVAA